jgi:hypothetical protein
MHVRVCVECGEEYRPEIAACAECGGRLEDRNDDGERTVLPPAVPAETGPGPDAAFTDAVLHADRATDLTDDADRLLEAGIEFRLRPTPGAGFRVLVSAADRDRALGVLGLLADADATARSGDCPACGTRIALGAVECPECGLVAGDDPEGDSEPD